MRIERMPFGEDAQPLSIGECQENVLYEIVSILVPSGVLRETVKAGTIVIRGRDQSGIPGWFTLNRMQLFSEYMVHPLPGGAQVVVTQE